MSEKTRYLLCPPDHFRVEYSINPWMGGEVDVQVAMTEWLALENEIMRAGAGVDVIDPHPDLPDMVFTANAGAVKDGAVVISNFKHKERRGESEEYAKWFEKQGFAVHRVPKLQKFEGCGDVEFIGDVMVGGFGFRSDLAALEFAAEKLGAKYLIPLRLVDPRFYHLDTCFAYLGGPDRLAIYYPGAFLSDVSVNGMMMGECKLIPVSESDATQFVCNSVVIGNTVIMPENNAEVTQKIIDAGFKVVQVKAGEFMKAGGSLRCLSLDITK